MVIMGSRDGLFPSDAMNASFAIIEQCYAKAESREKQQCRLFDAPHEFNSAMQAQAWEWVKRWI